MFCQGVVYLLVDLPFVAGQVQLGKEPVLGEHIVGDESVPPYHLRHLLLLLSIAAEQEEHLCLKGVPGARLVELGQKRVLFKDLEEQPGAEVLAEHAGQRRLADADGPFDDDMPGAVQGVWGHDCLSSSVQLAGIILQILGDRKWSAISCPLLRVWPSGQLGLFPLDSAGGCCYNAAIRSG